MLHSFSTVSDNEFKKIRPDMLICLKDINVSKSFGPCKLRLGVTLNSDSLTVQG